MSARIGENRGLWLVGGVLIGLGVAYLWPHEPIRADQSDRNDKFAMLTIPASIGINGIPPSEAVFVLDFTTGRLQGFYLSPSANPPTFTQSYFRDVAADLNLNGKAAAAPQYAICGGQAQVTGQGATFGASLIYVAELTSGQLLAYAYPFTQQNFQVPAQPLIPVSKAEFRRPIAQ